MQLADFAGESDRPGSASTVLLCLQLAAMLPPRIAERRVSMWMRWPAAYVSVIWTASSLLKPAKKPAFQGRCRAHGA